MTNYWGLAPSPPTKDLLGELRAIIDHLEFERRAESERLEALAELCKLARRDRRSVLVQRTVTTGIVDAHVLSFEVDDPQVYVVNLDYLSVPDFAQG